MKTLSKVFNIIGIVIYSMCILAFIIWGLVDTEFAYMIGVAILLIFNLAICCIAIYSLENDDKNIGIGVVDLIFGSFLGGIFYLCQRTDYSDTNYDKKES